jgi:outer membrane protein assembly factor BamB
MRVGDCRVLRAKAVIICFFVAAAGIHVARGQGRGGTSWSTVSGDGQRTSWVRSDPRISKDTVQGADFQLLWKMKLDNQPRQLNALTQPLLLPNIISYKGFKALAYVGGSSDNVFSIDYDLGKMFWKTHLSESAATPQPADSFDCPGGLTAITRATSGAQPPAGAPGRGGGGGGRGGNSNVYAISSRGMLHTLNPQTGEDLSAPVAFLPKGTNVVGSILVDSVLYAATTNNCGGAPNGVWAVDLSGDVKKIVRWETQGGGVVGSPAPTIGTDGTIYIATGDAGSASSYSDAVIALEPNSLTLKDWFTLGTTAFAATPVAFRYKDRQVIVAANRDGRLYVLDGASLGGADHRTPLYKTPPYANGAADFAPGALATWEESNGTRWVLAPSGGSVHADIKFRVANGPVRNGGIVAFTLADHGGTLELQPAWISRDMTSPLPPIVINGVVFAISGGEYRTNDAQMSARQRAQRSKPAVLYALDAATGRELWSSGSTITSFVHGVGPSGGDGQIYVVTHDSTIYAFGIPLEH